MDGRRGKGKRARKGRGCEAETPAWRDYRLTFLCQDVFCSGHSRQVDQLFLPVRVDLTAPAFAVESSSLQVPTRLTIHHGRTTEAHYSEERH
jgi:hypothetical protein